ncbi:MAG: hypothetical protein ABI727_03310 [Nitrosospira sp.]
MITQTIAAVWLVDARTVSPYELGQFRGWFTASEELRYKRFVRAQRQRQFFIGRVLLRLALSKLLGVSTDMLSLTEQPSRAPLLTLSNQLLTTPGFSLSHSGDWIACAVSASTMLGLDVEVVNPMRDIFGMANQAFDSEEVIRLYDLPEEERIIAFHHLWVEKEARYKLGECEAPTCAILPHHADLSIALCSAKPLSALPMIVLTTFAQDQPIFNNL